MHLIRTDKQFFFTSSNEKEVEYFLQNRIQKKRLLQVTNDNVFYGKVESRHSKFELGQFPNRNSFRPIVVLTWHSVTNITVIESYFRLDNRIVLSFLLLPFLGMYLSITIQMILPFIVLSIITLIVFVVILILYNTSKKSTKEKLLALFADLKA